MSSSRGVRGRDREEGLSLEATAKPLGEAGQLRGVANRLSSLVQLPVAHQRSLDFRPFMLILSGLSWLAGLFSQLGKPAQGLNVCRIGCDQRFQMLALGGSVTVMEREPGLNLMKAGGTRCEFGQMCHSFVNGVNPVGRHCPLEPCVPDRGIVRSAPLTGIEPTFGFVIFAILYREIREA